MQLSGDLGAHLLRSREEIREWHVGETLLSVCIDIRLSHAHYVRSIVESVMTRQSIALLNDLQDPCLYSSTSTLHRQRL